MQEQIRKNRRPHETEMLGSHLGRRLSSALNWCMATDAIQFAIRLVDRVRITSISAIGHAIWNHPVGKRHQIDSEQLSSALNLTFLPWIDRWLAGLPDFSRLTRVSPNSGGAVLRMKCRSLNGVERCTSAEVETALRHSSGSAVGPLIGKRVGKLISAGLIRLVSPSSPCSPPIINCRISTPLARSPKRPTPPTNPVTDVRFPLASV